MGLRDALEFDLPALVFDEADDDRAASDADGARAWALTRAFFDWFGVEVQHARGLRAVLPAWDWLLSRYAAPLRYANAQACVAGPDALRAKMHRRFPELTPNELQYVEALLAGRVHSVRRLALVLGIAAHVRATAAQV